MAPILNDDMKRLVREQRLGYVATVSSDGMPNLSPKGSLTVWDDDHLMFADIESPHTIKNLSGNPNTEVNVVDPFVRKGYRFKGTCTIERTGAKYWKALEIYKADGGDVRRVRAIVFIQVASVIPLLSPVYLLGLTDQEVGRLWEEYHSKSAQKTVSDLIPPSDF
jgi:predicted pyridoxine 5'-phosphate oxidase superfamily flavin-nucleotide-binding protein